MTTKFERWASNSGDPRYDKTAKAKIPDEFPNRGFSVITPPLVETQLTGWLATVKFTRRNHRYTVKFIQHKLAQCERDGATISWANMPSIAKQVAHKAADFLKGA